MKNVIITYQLEDQKQRTTDTIMLSLSEPVCRSIMTDSDPWQRVAVWHVEELIRELGWLAGYPDGARLVSVEITDGRKKP